MVMTTLTILGLCAAVVFGIWLLIAILKKGML